MTTPKVSGLPLFISKSRIIYFTLEKYYVFTKIGGMDAKSQQTSLQN